MRAGRLILGVAVWLGILSAVAAYSALSQGWQDLTPEERDQVLRNYERHKNAPADRRMEVERQYQRWQGMSPEERTRLQQSYDRYRGMSDDERREFDRKYQSWRDRQGR